MKLKNIPWRLVRRVIFVVRVWFFTVPKPDTKTLVVDQTVEQMEKKLGSVHFTPNFSLSYRYRGEDLNMRRVYYNPGFDNPWRQVHVRGFILDSGELELMVHEEAASDIHPKAHIKEHEFSWERGLEELRPILEEKGIKYKKSASS